MSIEEIEKSITGYRKTLRRLKKRALLQIKPAVDPANVYEAEEARRQKSHVSYLWSMVRFVDDRVELISDERERTVVDCMLDGLTYEAIAEHMGVGTTQIHRFKSQALKRLYDSQFDTLAPD